MLIRYGGEGLVFLCQRVICLLFAPELIESHRPLRPDQIETNSEKHVSLAHCCSIDVIFMVFSPRLTCGDAIESNKHCDCLVFEKFSEISFMTVV